MFKAETARRHPSHKRNQTYSKEGILTAAARRLKACDPPVHARCSSQTGDFLANTD
jgi:hypothetical protein